MEKPISLEVSPEELEMIKVSVCERLNTWKATKGYFDGDKVGVLIEESQDADEAAWMIGRYRKLLGRLDAMQATE